MLLLPLGLAVWTGRPRFSPRALAVPAVLVVLALLTVSPWTIRNAVVFDRFIPVSTQLGSALAGTYNEQARADKENPASWRSIGHVPSYRALYARLRFIPEPEVEDILSERSKAFIREHPEYVGKVALWTTLRTFELGGLDWSRHTAGTISVAPGWANAGRRLLLDLRPARDRRRDHEGGAPHAAVGLADPAAALPQRRLPRGRDAALPDRHRPVHRDARRAGGHAATTNTSSVRGPCTPSTRSSSMSDVADGRRPA